MISPRLFAVLAAYLLALVLLAGTPLSAAEPPHKVALTQVGDTLAKAPSREDRGRSPGVAAADRYDAEDTPDPLADCTAAALTRVEVETVRVTCPRTAPRTHRPCAGLPTGPPNS